MHNFKIHQMRTYLNIQKIIAVLMIFIFMIEFTGCYSSRILAPSDITSKQIFSIRGGKTVYHVSDLTLSGELLSGRLGTFTGERGRRVKNDIYISSDLAVKIKSDTLSIPVYSIARIEQRVPDRQKTAALIVVLVLGGLGAVTGCTIWAINSLSSSKGTLSDIGDIFDYCFTSY